MFKKFWLAVGLFCAIGVNLQAQSLLDSVLNAESIYELSEAGPVSLWFQAGVGPAFLSYDGNDAIFLKEVYYRQNYDKSPRTVNIGMGVSYQPIEQLLFGGGLHLRSLSIGSTTHKLEGNTQVASFSYNRYYTFLEVPLFMRWYSFKVGKTQLYAQASIAPNFFVQDKIISKKAFVSNESVEQTRSGAYTKNVVNFNSQLSIGAEWILGGLSKFGLSFGFGQLGASIWRGEFKEKVTYLSFQAEYRRSLTFKPTEKLKSF